VEGDFIPTALIFFGDVNISNVYSTNNKFCYYSNTTGFITKSFFEDYLKNYVIPYIEAKQKTLSNNSKNIPPSLIILEGHSSRNNKDLLKYCIEKNIFFFVLPVNCSHLVQPLDKEINSAISTLFTVFH
jgi:hypothetical protein